MSAPAQLAAALSIAGSDSGGAAGIQADLLTFAACGVYGTTAVTAVTAQNHVGVSDVHPVPAESVRAQIQQVMAYYPITAIKVGMLLNVEIIKTVAAFLKADSHPPVVVDPVMISSSGAMLLEPSAVQILMQELLPNVTLITPNFDEAAVLLGQRAEATPIAMEHAALALARQFRVPVLLKGGHFPLDPVLDVLAGPEGVRARLQSPRIADVNTHGGGCILSSAITAYLARGFGLVEAVEHGHAFLQRAYAAPQMLQGKNILRPSPTL
ncbi:MAG TPA: bifunctional hydroxymethylpyrimidine kinase/phosphomethylpyrimidine kinase [Opitutales bacterium]|jgi:hydroxymethylpyrimidine/phosphomethylpyrimidine kinase|nr:bifunctional hydroxymethylpyrimidine kinase/phosphomethylpyrimidine kinase [Opitutales bacterium]